MKYFMKNNARKIYWLIFCLNNLITKLLYSAITVYDGWDCHFFRHFPPDRNPLLCCNLTRNEKNDPSKQGVSRNHL